MRRKALSMLLTFAMLFSLVLVPAAAADSQGNWYDEAMSVWAGRGVIRGNQRGDLNPTGNLTRAELAVMLDRIMGYRVKAGETTFTDVQPGDWFADPVLKAAGAGVLKGDGSTARPGSTITRQEATVMLARVLGLTGETGTAGNFTDEASIAPWAADAVHAMAAKGYIQGSNGLFRPSAPITRAEVLTILNNIFAGYYDKAGTYTENVTGSAVIGVGDVVLSDLSITGDLLIAEGVGDGNVTLNGVNLGGRLLVRGGGEHSIVIKGGSKINSVVVARQDGKVRVSVEGGADVSMVYVDDGSDAVKIEGSVKSVTVAGAESAVEITGSVDTVEVSESAVGSSLTVTKDAKVDTVTNAAPKAEVTVAGSVGKVEVAKTATDTSLTTQTGAKVENVTTNAVGTTVDGAKGTIDKVVAEKNASNTTVTTPGAKVENNSAEKVTSGTGTIDAGKTGTVAGTTTGGGSSSSGGGSSSNRPTPKWTVTFDVAGGTGAVDGQTVTSGSSAEKPNTDPTKANATFAGWFKDDVKYDFTTEVTSDLTLTAKWATPLTNQVDLFAASIDSPDAEKSTDGVVTITQYYNILYANGKDVTVWEYPSQGIFVMVGSDVYTYAASNDGVAVVESKKDKGGLVIFAGSAASDVSTDSKLTVESGKVGAIICGGYEKDYTGTVTVDIQAGSFVGNVFGSGMTSYGDKTAAAKSKETKINIAGNVTLVYAGGYAAVGVGRGDVIKYGEGTANCFVDKTEVTIAAGGVVNNYFGTSYSFGGTKHSTCNVYGTIANDKNVYVGYSSVAGTNGYTGSATMNVYPGGEIKGNLYLSMRGYVGDITLNNEGKINLLSLNPDGKDVASFGTEGVTVNNKGSGTIGDCRFDCGEAKTGIDNINPYPAKITVSGDVAISPKSWEVSKPVYYKIPDYQTIILKDGARIIAEDEAELTAALTLNGNVQLTEDVTLTKVVTILDGMEVTLDLNGHTLTGPAMSADSGAANGRAFEIAAGGTLNIVDTKGGGKLISVEPNATSERSFIRCNGETDKPGVFHLGETATIETKDKMAYAIGVFGPGQIIIDGTINAAETAISGNGLKGNEGYDITVNGTVTSKGAVAMYLPNTGTTRINGSVTGESGIEIRAGQLSVAASGSVHATGNTYADSLSKTGDGPIEDCSGIIVIARGPYGANSDLTVTVDGTVTSDSGDGIRAGLVSTGGVKSIAITSTSGTVTGAGEKKAINAVYHSDVTITVNDIALTEQPVSTSFMLPPPDESPTDVPPVDDGPTGGEMVPEITETVDSPNTPEILIPGENAE